MGWLTRVRRFVIALLWLAAAMADLPAAARSVLALDSRQQPVMLDDAGDAWLDPGGQAQVQDVAAGPHIRWQPTGDRTIYRLGGSAALWIRFTVPPTATRERWYLEVPYPGVDLVTLYSRSSSGEWLEQAAGDKLPVAAWPVPHRQPILPLAVSGEQPRVHYLRVQNGTVFGAPLQFVSENHLGSRSQAISVGLGMYVGLVVLAVVLGVLGAFTLHDKGYGLFAVSALMMCLTQASLTGLSGLHLWPHWPWLNDIAPQVLPLFAMATLLLFFAEIVSLRQRSGRLYATLLAGALISVPLAIYMLLTPDVMQRLRIIVLYVAPASLAGFGVVIWAAVRGDRYAPLVLLASAPVAISAFFQLARAAGLIATSFWTTHGMQVAIAVELPILLVVVAIRSQHRREHQRRIQGLDRIDPATGLINAAVFHERLVRLIARSQRLKLRSAMLLVDIGNIDHIRRQFDPDAARELTLRVAGRLLAASREFDTVARLSEHRFGILMEGPLHANEVAEAGPRVVARCMMPFKGRPIEWTAQVRVAQALIPMDGTNPAQLLSGLQKVLASAPADSRRAVFLLSESGAPRALAPV